MGTEKSRQIPEGKSVSTTQSREHQLQKFLNACQKNRKDNAAVADEREDTLQAIERFAVSVIDSNLPGFKIVKRRGSRGAEFVPSLLGRAYFPHLNTYMSLHNGDDFYSAHVGLFFAACKGLQLLGHRFMVPGAVNAQGVTDAMLFNRLVHWIRAEGRKPKFKKAIAQKKSRAFRKFLGLVDYVDALFDYVRSRLIVVRLDLGYRPESVSNMTTEQPKDDLKLLLKRMDGKTSLFSDLAGYIWVQENGDRSGYDHFHVFLAFTNDRLGNDSERGELVGKYWEQITDGRGRYFNCNRVDHKAKQSRLAVGRIEYYDTEMRYNLLFALAYCCKDDQKVQAKPKRTSRSFGHGGFPPVAENRLGRPRSIEVDAWPYLALIRS